MTKNNDNSNQEMSVDEILKSVRNVMTSRINNINHDIDEEILELINIDDEVTENISSENSNSDDLNLSSLHEVSSKLLSNESVKETTNIINDFTKTAKELLKDQKQNDFTPLEETIIQIIRPELSKWLDNNLPIIVREIVEKEIKNSMISDFQKK
jgi:cell pole-organizing protein PopZ